MLPLDTVALNQALAEFPNKANLVTFPPPFLGVNSEIGELFPVIQTNEIKISDLRDKLVLDQLQSVDGMLVSRRP